MSRTIQNVFQEGAYPIFSKSKEIAAKLRANRVKHSTLALYDYIVDMAKGPTVRLTTSIVLAEVNINPNTYRAARKELIENKVIRAKEVSKGIWEFELLSPEGRALPTSEYFIVFKELSPKDVTDYYEDRLGKPVEGRDSKGNILFTCPFCHFKKPLFMVTLDGSDHHGRYICGNNKKCGRHGGMIDLEQALVKHRSGKVLGYDTAKQKARSFFLDRIDATKAATQRAAWEAERKEAVQALPWYLPEGSTHAASQIDDLPDERQP